MTTWHSPHPTSVLGGNASTAVLKTSSKNTNEIQTVVLWPPLTHCLLDHEAWAIGKDSEQVIGPSKSVLLCRFPTQKICSGQRGFSRYSLLVSVPACVGGEDPAEAETHKGHCRPSSTAVAVPHRRQRGPLWSYLLTPGSNEKLQYRSLVCNPTTVKTRGRQSAETGWHACAGQVLRGDMPVSAS